MEGNVREILSECFEVSAKNARTQCDYEGKDFAVSGNSYVKEFLDGTKESLSRGNSIDSLGTISNNQRIIAVCSVDQLAIVVTTNDSDLHVWKFTVDEVNNTCSEFKEVWFANGVWEGNAPGKISAVLYKELENVIKLYIATGKDPIISLRVDDEQDHSYITNGTPVPIDSLINNREIPDKRVVITDIISGRLTTQQV